MASGNVAELIADTLAQAGVRRIFGVVGDSLNGLTDAQLAMSAATTAHGARPRGARKSAAAISRRRIRRICSGNAAIFAS